MTEIIKIFAANNMLNDKVNILNLLDNILNYDI